MVGSNVPCDGRIDDAYFFMPRMGNVNEKDLSFRWIKFCTKVIRRSPLFGGTRLKHFCILLACCLVFFLGGVLFLGEAEMKEYMGEMD